jgi:hypothetical protein
VKAHFCRVVSAHTNQLKTNSVQQIFNLKNQMKMYHSSDKSLWVGLLLTVLLFSCSESPKPATSVSTISSTDFAATQKPATTTKYVLFDPTKFTATFAEGENQTWDFSANKASTSNAITVNYLTPLSNTSFKTATYALRSVSKVLNLDLTLTDHYEIFAMGLYDLGSQIEAKPVSLGNGVVLTPVGNESAWTPKLQIFKFPMNYKDSYNAESTLKESFKLTAPPFGVTDAPTDRVGTVKKQTQVVGWGKLILPSDANATTSDVLLVKTTATFTYNYLVGGNPAPAALTGALGLTQGESITRVFYEFISKNGGSIASISFEADATGKAKLPPFEAYYKSK